MQQALSSPNKIKLHFLIKKKVSYGFAVYVIGSAGPLGAWTLHQCFRLNWNPEDYWSGFVELAIRDQLRVQFKYLIAHYEAPVPGPIEWEEGEFNRQVILNSDEDNVVIENVWNANKISLNLLVPKIIIKPDTEFYLAGGCKQLGNWKSRLRLTRVEFVELPEPEKTKAKQYIIVQDYQVYSVSLTVDRNLRNFMYYFIKQEGNELIPDRVPQREFKVYLCENQNPSCLNISNWAGNYELLELSKFVSLHYEKITERIFIGGCIETCEDVKQLKKKGVNALVYLKSGEMTSYKLAPRSMVRMVSEENKIEYYSLNMDVGRIDELIQQAREALDVLARLILNQEKNVYIFCSTGCLLSSLLAALYLSVYDDYPLKKALEYVKEKYPLVAINQSIMAIAEDLGHRSYFSNENSGKIMIQ